MQKCPWAFGFQDSLNIQQDILIRKAKRLKGLGDVLLHSKWQTLKGLGDVLLQQDIDMKSKKVKRFGRWVIACQVTDIEGNWQGWQPAGSGNLPVSRFSFISDYLVVLSLLWESGIALRIQTWRYLEITLRGKNSKTNYIQAYLRSKVTGVAAWSKCKFSCSGFPSILVPQLIAQNHSSIELDAASKGWIGWLFISIRPKADHCLGHCVAD